VKPIQTDSVSLEFNNSSEVKTLGKNDASAFKLQDVRAQYWSRKSDDSAEASTSKHALKYQF
jgi:hypothetical protein